MSKEADDAKEAEEADGITDVERVRRTLQLIDWLINRFSQKRL